MGRVGGGESRFGGLRDLNKTRAFQKLHEISKGLRVSIQKGGEAVDAKRGGEDSYM